MFAPSQSLRAATSSLVSLVAVAQLLGCGVGVDDAEPLPEGALLDDTLGEVSSEVKALGFEYFEDPLGIGSRGAYETRIVFASQDAYVSYFGHKAPPSVDFASGDGVVFYAAGTQQTGGFVAGIAQVQRSNSGKTLYVTTQLVSPGPTCVVAPALTKPYVLAKVKLPKHARYVGWSKDDLVEDCEAWQANPCMTVRCAGGYQCVVLETYPPQAACVPVVDEGAADGGSAPEPVKCGKTTCAQGQVCCNESCGICTPPGGGCIKLYCGE